MLNRISRLIVLTMLVCFWVNVPAQMTSPEDPGGGPESGDAPLGGGAPLGSGAVLLISFGVLYTGIKLVKGKKSLTHF